MSALLLKLEDRKWGSFVVGDLFNVVGAATLSTDEKRQAKSGNIPCISSKKYNNGVTDFYDVSGNDGNVLTIESAFEGACFYQPVSFSAYGPINKLIPKFEMNKYIGLFFVTLFNLEKEKYCYGHKYNQKRIKETVLSLPITDTGSPDYDFMENYMKQFERNYSDYFGSVISSQISLRDRSFKDFKVGDVFKVSKTTCEEIPKELARISGVPYLTSALENNGVCMYVNKEDEPSELYKGNCITVSVFPKKKSSFYQDSDFYAGGGAGLNILRNENLNKFNSLFIVACLDSEIVPRVVKGKRMTLDRLFDLVISLPVTISGEIDWQFMEDYIKSRPLSRCIDLLSK